MSWLLRSATPEDDRTIAAHFRQMWLDLDYPPAAIHADWQPRILDYIVRARQDLAFAAFMATDAAAPDRPNGDRPIGSVSCQRFAGLYPDILQPEYRHYGYIWGVFVEASWRRRGIGKALTQRAIDRLREIGCTRAVLNASPLGVDLYRQLGFVPGNDMFLDL